MAKIKWIPQSRFAKKPKATEFLKVFQSRFRKRTDVVFRLAPNYHKTMFRVEAKKK